MISIRIIKKNISIIKNPIEKLLGIHGVHFEWVPNKEANNIISA
jgi:hypothetical protein